jgi:starch phosphorylase
VKDTNETNSHIQSPPLLAIISTIAHNLRWSWDHAAIELFRRLDRDLWEASGHNPVLLLGTVDQDALETAASDDSFLAHIRGVAETLNSYVSGEGSWYTPSFSPQPEVGCMATPYEYCRSIRARKARSCRA